jgi:hypothetical protein
MDNCSESQDSKKPKRDRFIGLCNIFNSTMIQLPTTEH